MLPTNTHEACSGERLFCRTQGYAFCEYADLGATDFVIQSLNGKPVGNKFLTVKRALGPAGGPFEQPRLAVLG